jgi:GMP synthase (glutamine-hydrolysing)
MLASLAAEVFATMRVLVIENYPGTPLGQVGTALAEAGIATDIRQVWQGDSFPADPDGFAGLVVLGGEQSAVDDAEHPYLPQVAALTKAFGEADKAVLGICLGAQLVARGYGATNILGRPIEFGWQTVRPTGAGHGDSVLAALGDGSPVFHWHVDTFTLPPGATHLATSAMTEIQAFRIDRAVYGVQFHFEADRPLVERWSSEFAELIGKETPDWQRRREGDAARYGTKADATGLAIARAWVKQVR